MVYNILQITTGTKKITPKGYVLKRWFELTLTGEDEELDAIIKIVKTVDGKITVTKENC